MGNRSCAWCYSCRVGLPLKKSGEMRGGISEGMRGRKRAGAMLICALGVQRSRSQSSERVMRVQLPGIHRCARITTNTTSYPVAQPAHPCSRKPRDEYRWLGVGQRTPMIRANSSDVHASSHFDIPINPPWKVTLLTRAYMCIRYARSPGLTGPFRSCYTCLALLSCPHALYS